MLSRDQLSFFARNGFLHLASYIDADVCGELVDHTWTRLPAEWSRNDPATWTGSLGDSCHTADLYRRRGLLQFQGGDLVTHPTIQRVFSSNGIGGDLARDLIGHPLSNFKIRGLYAIIPLPPSMTYPGGGRAHIEAHPSQLISLCYLEDVVPGGGGLHVWPGSHLDIYPAMGSKLEYVSNPEYEEIYRRWTALAPLELPGKRGDIVIIHHRLLHAPSLNRSPNIRYGFLCDYMRNDYKELCAQAPGDDVWEDWPAIARLSESERCGASDYSLEKLGGKISRPLSWSLEAGLSADRREIGDPTSVKKADASVLARARVGGDVWLALSDHPITADDKKLFPRGSDLSQDGVEVSINGERLRSLCQYDFICKVPNQQGKHEIRISGLKRTAWLRVLRIELPFENTQFLMQKELSATESSLQYVVSDSA
jgi:hypothetical protein